MARRRLATLPDEPEQDTVDLRERFDAAMRLMQAFAARTDGGYAQRASRRYLWTDAFAVCNLLALGRQAPACRSLALAQDLERPETADAGEQVGRAPAAAA